MSKNSARIKEGIINLSREPYEIMSGKVLPGSTDTSAYTISVQPSDGSAPIEGVMLNNVTENGKGLILFPKDDSDVVVGSIDGPGEWTLLKASEIRKAIITIENVVYEMNDTAVTIQNGSTHFNINTSVFKMNTASESLYQLLNDLITGITLLTVGTGTGPSTVPANVATFNTLLTRLNNLLSA
jgi:hypothetical protein